MLKFPTKDVSGHDRMEDGGTSFLFETEVEDMMGLNYFYSWDYGCLLFC